MKTFEDFGISIPAGRNGNVYTTCPQCSPHRKKSNAKCLSVDVDQGLWNCHHPDCSWSGTLKEGSKDRSNHSASRPKVFRKPVYNGVTPDNGKMLEWFSTRGITADVVRDNHISVGQVFMPQVEKEVSAIRFPFYHHGEVINIKSRDKDKNFRMETGAERIFYGMDGCIKYLAITVNGLKTLIIVEGEIDKLSCEVAGYLNCVSVPDGAPSPKAKDYTSKFSFLESCEEFLAGFDLFIIAVDNDAAGQKLEEELVRRLGAERCKRVVWPDGCKDANEVIVKHGAATLRECIENAVPYPIAGLFEVADFATSIDRMYEKGLPPGAKPGWPSLNQLITFQTGQWTVVTGIPGDGKSEFIDATMVNLATTYGWTFAIFSPENQPLELHFQKLAEKHIGKPFFNSRHTQFARMSPQDLDAAKEWIGKRFTFVLPESDGLSIDNILKLARVTVRRKGVQGVVLDPWNELDHLRPAALSETEYISATLTKIRRFARENGVHVWLVAHPAKLKKEKNERGEMVYPVPTPYDISGSAHWRNKADNAMTIYRNRTVGNDLVQIHVQKVRFKHCGKTGATELRYDCLTGRYDEPFGTPLDLDGEE